MENTMNQVTIEIMVKVNSKVKSLNNETGELIVVSEKENNFNASMDVKNVREIVKAAVKGMADGISESIDEI